RHRADRLVHNLLGRHGLARRAGHTRPVGARRRLPRPVDRARARGRSGGAAAGRRAESVTAAGRPDRLGRRMTVVLALVTVVSGGVAAVIRYLVSVALARPSDAEGFPWAV